MKLRHEMESSAHVWKSWWASIKDIAIYKCKI